MTLIRRSLQQLAYSMAMPEPQESAENKYLGHRMLFNSKINAVIKEKLQLPRVYEQKTMKRMPCLREVWP